MFSFRGLLLIALLGCAVHAQSNNGSPPISEKTNNFNSVRFTNQDVNALHEDGFQALQSGDAQQLATPNSGDEEKFIQQKQRAGSPPQPYYEEKTYEYHYGPKEYTSQYSKILPFRPDIEEINIDHWHDHSRPSREVIVVEPIIKPAPPPEPCTVTEVVTTTYFVRPKPVVTEYTTTTVYKECPTVTHEPKPPHKHPHPPLIPCHECHHPHNCEHCHDSPPPSPHPHPKPPSCEHCEHPHKCEHCPGHWSPSHPSCETCVWPQNCEHCPWFVAEQQYNQQYNQLYNQQYTPGQYGQYYGQHYPYNYQQQYQQPYVALQPYAAPAPGNSQPTATPAPTATGTSVIPIYTYIRGQPTPMPQAPPSAGGDGSASGRLSNKITGAKGLN